ncbi:hypothetical protein E1181_11535 [Saccharopolyspora terrae]|uniref:WXG100 family type VII secretion target n=1 Tax=Saccharopolyspora terrae TaxID=2530384 RepID=A0A4R4VS10_9PSEU|nr:hypothetical protein [Saccharopolyspora terrae]TDD06917.1 hypothetical protein E1181_11535 [Saccharopolyspora terrae]
MSDLTVTPADLRGWSGDCTDVANRIKSQLEPADSACADVRKALDDWDIADGVSGLQQRWEALNELLRDELDDAAEAFEESADQYDDDELRIVEWFRHLF